MDWTMWILLYVGVVALILVFFAGATHEERASELASQIPLERDDAARTRAQERNRQLELALDSREGN